MKIPLRTATVWCLSAVLFAGFAARPCVAATKTVTWNPLLKQEREPDTMFLLDADAEAKWKPGEGGLIAGNASGGDVFPGKVVAADGKFRRGYQSNVREYGYLWMPAVGLMAPNEWTVEYWIKTDAAPDTLQDIIPLAIWDEHGSGHLEWVFSGGGLRCTFRHNQSATPVNVNLNYDLKQHPLAVGTWHSIAATFGGGTLRSYVDGELAGEAKDIPVPRIWNDAVRGDGISILGAYGRGSNGVSLSDLRISRRARTPGQPLAVSDTSTLAITNTPTGAHITQELRGALHYFSDDKTAAMGKDVLRVMRTDKMLTSTPIKAGAPDATHPSKGVSGRFSYDWQVVDRTFDYYKKLGVMPYISIDSTPEILGGKTPPFADDKLKNPEAKTGWSGFTPEVPNDIEAFGAIVQDLVNHAVKERHDNVPYWGVWNEPDGPGFFSNKLDDYLKVYDVCARAVRAVDPNLKVGGPETAEYNAVWIEGLIKHCAETKTPLDFVSWHYYLGDLNEFAHAKMQVGAWSKAYGSPNTPSLINGEWTWQANNLFGTGYAPFRDIHYHLNDWNAAFMGASLIEMQNAGVSLSIFTNPVALRDSTSWDSSGLFGPDAPWATGNVFRLWAKMAPDIVQSNYNGVPGVWSVASRDKTGRITIFLSYLRYRKDVAPVVNLQIPGVPANAKITHYVVDDAHSNALDAGAAHAELETVAPPKLAGGQMPIELRGRSVHLLVIEPAAKK